MKKISTGLVLLLFSIGFSYGQLQYNGTLQGEQTSVAYEDDADDEKDSPLNLPDELAICGTEEGEIEIQGKFKEIHWSTGAKTSFITVQDTGMYHVKVFDGVEWYKDSIRVVRVPELKYNPSQTSILCEGKTARLVGNMDAKSWQWNTGTSKWGISVTKPGDYYVVSSNECYAITDTFHVVKSGDVPIKLTETIPTCLKNNIPVTAFGPAENYKWNTGHTSQQILVNSAGTYEVSFKVCDSIITQNFTVDVKARSANPLYFPNVFTPNNDNINDDFKMVGSTDQITDYQISIFNRWGVLMFKSNDPSFEWNGMYKGSVVPDGVYFYGGGYRHNCTGDQYISIEGTINVQR